MLSASLVYGLFSPQLGERLQASGATPAGQAQAIGEVVENGTAAYLASYRTTVLVMASLIALAAGLGFRSCRAAVRRSERLEVTPSFV